MCCTAEPIWRESVLEFNLRSQMDLLSRLGIDSPGWQHLGWAFAGGLVLWLAWVATTLQRSLAREKPDRIARAWLRALRKLEKVSKPRAPDEGAISFARRISAEHPHLAEQRHGRRHRLSRGVADPLVGTR